MRTVDSDPSNTPPVASRASTARRRGGVALALAGVVALAAACSHDGRTMRDPSPDQNLSIITTTTVAASVDDGSFDSALPSLPIDSTPAPTEPSTTVTTSSAVVDSGPISGFTITAPWPDGGVVDARYTCTGEDAAPILQWSNVPPDAAELAVVVIDPDADNFVHWVVAGISPGVTGIAGRELPPGAVQGVNGFGNLGWNGPCPPAGESHAYRFEVHALSQPSGLADGTVGDGMLRVIDGDTLEYAVSIGNFPGG